MSSLFGSSLQIVNVGLQSFIDPVASTGARAVQVDWTPPAGGNRVAGWCLAQLLNHPAVESANEKAYAALLDAQPVLTGVGTARDELKLSGRMVLHAGPPIAWAEMCGPMRITTGPWARWPGSSARRCRCGSWRTRPAATAPSPT